MQGTNLRPGFHAYVLVWIALLGLTGLSVYSTAYMQQGASLPLIIAFAKSYLVAFFFMHLWYEKAIFKIFLLIALAAVAVLWAMILSDILYR